MKKTTRKVLIIILGCVLLVSLGMLGYKLIQYREGDKTYDEAAKLAGVPDFADPGDDGDPEDAENTEDTAATGTDVNGDTVRVDSYSYTLRDVDLAALRKKNSDVQGWIFIPGTAVSYPVVYGSGKAATYYLTHTWTGASGIVGSIFIDPANSSDFSNFNTVIYGHNMRNGSMFGTLSSFASQSYWKSHKNIYITTDAGAKCYQIFAAYEVPTSGETYQISFSSDKARQDFIDSCLKQSVISTGVTPTANDNIITLSTCTGSGHATRWVVQAALKNTAPAAAPPTPSPSPAPEVTATPEITVTPDITGTAEPPVTAESSETAGPAEATAPAAAETPLPDKTPAQGG